MKKIIYCIMCLAIFISSISIANENEYDCEDSYKFFNKVCNRNYYKFDIPPHHVSKERYCEVYAELQVVLFAKIHNEKQQDPKDNVICEPKTIDDWLWPEGDETVFEAADRILEEQRKAVEIATP